MSLQATSSLRSAGSFAGYPYTFSEIKRHLKNVVIEGQKLQIDINNPKSKVQVGYGLPPGRFFEHQYKVQMTQWESTQVMPHCLELDAKYDEWWTANYFGAQAMINSGISEHKVYVYEHGVDSHIWTPKLRSTQKKIRFLHVDAGQPRKRSDVALKAFKSVFGENSDYELTLKYSGGPLSHANWSSQHVLENEGEFEGNVRRIKENLSLEDLVKLYHFHDILIYPSEGEGFGLIPLQALATGMPVISTGRWCSYEEFLNDNVIDSKLGKSEVEERYERFGDVVIPDQESTEYLMRRVADNIEEQSGLFFAQSEAVAQRYDWQSLTDRHMERFVQRVGAQMFLPTKAHFL